MTTAAPSRASSLAAARLTAAGIARSEWTKLRSLRSTVWSLIVAVVLIVGLAAIICAATAANWNQLDPIERATFDAAGISVAGSFLAQLAIGVLGVLLISGEYSTGMIRATMSAVPRRLPALWAKAAVFSVVTFVVTGIAALIAFTLGQRLLRSTGVSAHLGDAGVLRAVIGSALYVTAVGLLGMGFGALLRHTAGAISMLVGVLLLLPTITAFLPSSWQDHIRKFLPGDAGQQIMRVREPFGEAALSPWVGFGVFVAYVAVVMAGAAVLLKRRDV
jgi:ABC-type transport system involved in multi-copper enzyme maturation permease subunit